MFAQECPRAMHDCIRIDAGQIGAMLERLQIAAKQFWCVFAPGEVFDKTKFIVGAPAFRRLRARTDSPHPAFEVLFQSIRELCQDVMRKLLRRSGAFESCLAPRLIDEPLNDAVLRTSPLDATLQKRGDPPVDRNCPVVRFAIGSVDLARTLDQIFAREFAVGLGR
ncbi:hypothetical protein J8I87_31625 [Paraburkholderia sp. LEh10]|uniref:hypothetical protein n=1 Tax=Paraburkholderia sp. LEh10 TaxID=2821353 RepID=UPI001AE2C1AF|nr:hypothetical protein [Paraburkholderia sp. LEh10]MBP0594144.1 hypothetical protein [Paraburkholderia sp. LEh10]